MQKGKNIKVFLSSTFKDMDAERDLIMNRVAPLLQERLSSEGISVQFIDLRWGSLVLSSLDYWGVAMDGFLLMIVGR